MARFPTHLALLVTAIGVALTGCTATEGAMNQRMQEEVFTLDHHALPDPTLRWVECDAGGGNEGRMRTVGRDGTSMTLSAGHVLEVRNGVVAGPTDFVFVEPRSKHIVVDVSASVKTVAAEGFRLVVRWGHRNGCNMPDNPVLMRVVPGGVAERVGEKGRSEGDFIEATVDSLSTFAIAG